MQKSCQCVSALDVVLKKRIRHLIQYGTILTPVYIYENIVKKKKKAPFFEGYMV